MFKKVGAIGVMGAALAVVAATALSGTAAARVSAADATVSCKSPVTIGVAYPASGPETSIGTLQYNWARQAVTNWNKSHSVKVKLLPGNTELGVSTTFAISVANSFKANSSVVAVTGPAGSQEMQDTANIWKQAGLAPISGSETRVALTRSVANPHTGPRETTPGYFFRTVPNDGQQAATAAAYIKNVLHLKKVEIIDDSEGYSTGLRDFISTAFAKEGVTVTKKDEITETPLQTDFSTVIARIPAGTQLIYIPWQTLLAGRRTSTTSCTPTSQAPRSSSWVPMARTTRRRSRASGSYLTAFPYSPSNPVVKAYAHAHGGDPQTFGLPSYTATMANATAIQTACKAHGNKITRTEVRQAIQKTTLTAAQGLLGFPV